MKSFRLFDPKNEINFVKYFKPMLVVAALVPVVAIVGALVIGINWGLDFRGGTEMQVEFNTDVPSGDIEKALESAGFTKHQVQRYGAAGSTQRLIRVERLETFKPEDVTRIESLVTSKFPSVGDKKTQVRFTSEVGDRLLVYLPEPKVDSNGDHALVVAALATQRDELATLIDTQSGFKLRRTKGAGDAQLSIEDAVKGQEPKNGVVAYSVYFTGVSDKIKSALVSLGIKDVHRTSFVDSQVSQELRTQGFLAVMFALFAILVYIAIRFDFFFAPGAIVALVQDTFGAFLVFVFFGYEFDLPSVAALLTVLGVSINNTIVVYDRIRETVPATNKPTDDAHVTAAVNKAINDTLSRTINTTLTTVIAATCLWWFAGGVIESFAMVLMVGLSLGALSSSFASPASYLFMRRRFGHLGETVVQNDRGRTREDKARGVV